MQKEVLESAVHALLEQQRSLITLLMRQQECLVRALVGQHARESAEALGFLPPRPGSSEPVSVPGILGSLPDALASCPTAADDEASASMTG